MSSPEKLSSDLKQSFRRTFDQLHRNASSILTLTQHWLDLETRLHDALASLEDRAEEIRSLETSTREEFEELGRRQEEFQAIRVFVERRALEIEAREKLAEERMSQAAALRTEAEAKERECKEFLEELKLKEDGVERKCRDIESKDRDLERRVAEVELREVMVERKMKEIKSREKEIMESSKEVEKKENHFEKLLKEIELKEKEIELRCKEVELKEKKIEGLCGEVDIKEEKADETVNIRVKGETLEDMNAMGNLADASLCFSVKMDGKALQVFLNKRWKDQDDSLKNEVAVALQMSPDPAKLVLDAMQGFYPPLLKEGEVEFEEGVVRRSCILLLEQLMKISLEIRPQVRKEAMRISLDWMSKMRVDAEHSLEVLGFLQLLASYNLASAFDADELLNHLEIVAHCHQAPALLCALGFADKITGFVQNLVRKKQIEAITFVYAFQLCCEFPPVPFLKDYLEKSKYTFRKITNQDKSLETRVESTNKLLVDMQAVLTCIEDHNIESELSPELLKKQIDKLEKEISDAKSKLAAPGYKAQSPYLNEEKCFAPKVATAVNPVYAPKSASSTSPVLFSSAIASKTLSPQQSGIKRPWTAVSAGDNPSAFVDSAHGKNPNALQFVADPAKHVLDVIKNFCSLDVEDQKDFKSDVSTESCILLLQQLRKVAPRVGMPVKEEALNFAGDWKTKLRSRRRGQWEVVLFVEFLATYKSASSFNAEELLFILHANVGPKKFSDLCQVLGLVDKVPDFIKILIERDCRIEAIRYIYALKLVDKFPPVRLLRDHLHYTRKKAKKLLRKDNGSIKSQVGAIMKKIAALRTVIQCIEFYNLESEFSPGILREEIVQLEKLKEEKRSKVDDPETETGLCTYSKSNSLQNTLQKNKKNNPNDDLVSTPVIVPTADIFASSPSPTTLIVFSPPTGTAAVASPATVMAPSSAAPTASTLVTCPSTVAPASAIETQPQDHIQNKRCRIAVSLEPPVKASPGDTAVHLTQQFHQRPPAWYQGAPYMPTGIYGSGHPPPNPQPKSSHPPNPQPQSNLPLQPQSSHPPTNPQLQSSCPPMNPQLQSTHPPMNPQPQLNHPSTNSQLQLSDTPTNLQPHLSHPLTNPQPQLSHPPRTPQSQFSHPLANPQPQVSHPPSNLQLSHHPTKPQPQLSHPPTNPQAQLSHPPTNPRPQLHHPPMNLQFGNPLAYPQMRYYYYYGYPVPYYYWNNQTRPDYVSPMPIWRP